MYLIIRKKHLLAACLLVLCTAVTAALLQVSSVIETFVVADAGSRPLIVVDPGHGGEDGGAVSADNSKESDLNLAIAHKTDALLHFMGYSTRMTRSEDLSIHSDEALTLRQKKVSDLTNRAALVNERADCLLLSIHQNSLPSSPSTHGAQAFYNRVDGSELLAEGVQQSLNFAVNGAHPKEKKQISDTIFLMKKVQRPAVLVECGFLTNAAETALLQSDAHQMKLSAAIVSGLLRAITQ